MRRFPDQAPGNHPRHGFWWRPDDRDAILDRDALDEWRLFVAHVADSLPHRPAFHPFGPEMTAAGFPLVDRPEHPEPIIPARMTGMRLCIGAQSALGSVVRIVNVSSLGFVVGRFLRAPPIPQPGEREGRPALRG